MLVDLYQLTMAQAYWRSGHTSEATFSLYFRTLPSCRGFHIFAGLEDVLDFLDGFAIDPADLDYLESRGDFDPAFLKFLCEVRFTGSVRAMPEGTPCFAQEPVLEVTGPVIEAQLVETYLLNQVNLQTTLTTKAYRVVAAARPASVIDFGARRAQGTDAAMKMARASYIAGFSGTSNVEAAERYGIPGAGTMAHSFITTFEEETEAFRAFVQAFPRSATLLVDTYDTLKGVAAAVTVAREAQDFGGRIAAIRLDSGDLSALARRSRRLLDNAGLRDVKIVASGGLDEHSIGRLASGGAPIDVYGVGTRVVVSADAPSTDSVYKMVEYDGEPVIKLSSGKENLPGPKQVYRLAEDGRYVRDRIQAPAETAPPGDGWHALLGEVMRGGRRTARPASLTDLRRRVSEEMERLPEELKDLDEPDTYPVETSGHLAAIARAMEERRSGSGGQAG